MCGRVCGVCSASFRLFLCVFHFVVVCVCVCACVRVCSCWFSLSSDLCVNRYCTDRDISEENILLTASSKCLVLNVGSCTVAGPFVFTDIPFALKLVRNSKKCW